MCYNQTDVLWFIKQNENNLLLSLELDIFFVLPTVKLFFCGAEENRKKIKFKEKRNFRDKKYK